MVKWVISILVIVLILTIAFKYSAFITENKNRRKDGSVSMVEMGKIIDDIREMGKERKEDIEKNEKEIGENY